MRRARGFTIRRTGICSPSAFITSVVGVFSEGIRIVRMQSIMTRSAALARRKCADYRLKYYRDQLDGAAFDNVPFRSMVAARKNVSRDPFGAMRKGMLEEAINFWKQVEADEAFDPETVKQAKKRIAELEKLLK